MIIFSEKLYATSFGDENPIADAVIKQCPHLSEEISNTEGVEKRLSGNEILNILCEGQCEEQKNYGKGNRTVPLISLLDQPGPRKETVVPLHEKAKSSNIYCGHSPNASSDSTLHSALLHSLVDNKNRKIIVPGQKRLNKGRSYS